MDATDRDQTTGQEPAPVESGNHPPAVAVDPSAWRYRALERLVTAVREWLADTHQGWTGIVEAVLDAERALGMRAASKLDRSAELPRYEPPAVLGTPSGDVVTVCGWCPELRVLTLQRQRGDQIVFLLEGEKLAAYRWRRFAGETTALTISHGICLECKAKHFPTTGQAARP